MAIDARTSTPNVHAVWHGKIEMNYSFKKRGRGFPGLKFRGVCEELGKWSPTSFSNERPTTGRVIRLCGIL
jgi:hypothetical protein